MDCLSLAVCSLLTVALLLLVEGSSIIGKAADFSLFIQTDGPQSAWELLGKVAIPLSDEPLLGLDISADALAKQAAAGAEGATKMTASTEIQVNFEILQTVQQSIRRKLSQNPQSEEFSRFCLSPYDMTASKPGDSRSCVETAVKKNGLLSHEDGRSNKGRTSDVEVFKIHLTASGAPLGLSYSKRRITAEFAALWGDERSPRMFVSVPSLSNGVPPPPPKVKEGEPQERSFFAKYWWVLLAITIAVNFLGSRS